MANTVDKVITIAKAEVGYLEKKSNKDLDKKTANAGSNNYTKYGRDMHEIYPSVMDFPAYWCDAFVDWCFYKAYGKSNAKGLLGGNFDDYTVASAQLYKNKGAWHDSNPRVGDQIFFKSSTRINHTGIVCDVDSTYVYTIEGNTSSSSSVVANGGCVAKKKYLLTNSKIAGYGRPAYDKEVNKPPYTKIKKTSSKSKIKWLQKKLNANCQAILDGDMKPLVVDGIWGSKTFAALKAYWKQLGWNTSGTYAGEKTCTALWKNRKK